MNALVVEGMEANPAMRDPRDWAKDCRALAAVETDLEAQSAFNQLAEEFEAVAMEIEGLANTFDVLVGRKARP
jgi:hypothetical protein